VNVLFPFRYSYSWEFVEIYANYRRRKTLKAVRGQCKVLYFAAKSASGNILKSTQSSRVEDVAGEILKEFCGEYIVYCSTKYLACEPNVRQPGGLDPFEDVLQEF
jgi:hypothetical protein